MNKRIVIITGSQTNKGTLLHNLLSEHNIKEMLSVNARKTNASKHLGFFADFQNIDKNTNSNDIVNQIADLYMQYPEHISLVTQNIDTQLEKAGCSNTLHIFGDISKTKCLSCGKQYENTAIGSNCTNDHFPLNVEKCAGKIYPDITMLGENTPKQIDMFVLLKNCDLSVLIGVDEKTINIHDIVRFSKKSVIINEKELEIYKDVSFSESHFGEISPALKDVIEKVKIFIDPNNLPIKERLMYKAKNFLHDFLQKTNKRHLMQSKINFEVKNVLSENTIIRYDIFEYLDQSIEITYNPNACTKTSFVLTRSEADILNEVIKNMPSEDRLKILSRLKKLNKKYKHLKKDLQLQTAKDHELLHQENHYSCPFLIDNKCSVRNYMPLVCRGNHSKTQFQNIITQTIEFVYNDKYNLGIHIENGQQQIVAQAPIQPYEI